MQQHFRLQELHYPAKNGTYWIGAKCILEMYVLMQRTLIINLNLVLSLLNSFIEGDELIPDFSVVFLKGGVFEMGDN